MSLSKQLGLGFLILAAILGLEYYTDWDVALQNHFFYVESKEWLINRELHQRMSFVFYKGIKNSVIAIGIVSLLYFALSFRYQKLKTYRRFALLLFLSIVFVPLIVAGSKTITNVYCPAQLNIYDGQYPFVRVLENYPEDFVQVKKGRCFPAGHSTVGFSLMMLYFCFHNKRRKIIALGGAISLGWITGLYQMLRGQHFLSHTAFSMVASWMVIIIIVAIVDKVRLRYGKN